MKLGLFSISYGGFWGQETLDLIGFIERAATLGYSSVMLAGKRPHLSPLDASQERLAELKAALTRHQIDCAALGAYTDFAATCAAEVPVVEMQLSYVEALARIATELGAPVVRVFTAYDSPTLAPAAAWSRVVACLRECVDRAATYGVTIAVQNHHDLAVHTDALLELLYDVDRPQLKIGFDAWSPALRGEDLYEAARRMAPHTAITTNADYIRLPRYAYQPALVNYQRQTPDLVRAVEFGAGCIDYKAFFTGLVDGGFDGLATYEMCSPLRGGGSRENLDRYAQRYVEWMGQHVPVSVAAGNSQLQSGANRPV